MNSHKLTWCKTSYIVELLSTTRTKERPQGYPTWFSVIKSDWVCYTNNIIKLIKITEELSMKIIVKETTYNKMMAVAELLDHLFLLIGRACLSILGGALIVAIGLGLLMIPNLF